MLSIVLCDADICSSSICISLSMQFVMLYCCICTFEYIFLFGRYLIFDVNFMILYVFLFFMVLIYSLLSLFYI